MFGIAFADFIVVGEGHNFYEVVEGGFGLPAEDFLCLGIIADEEVDFGGAEVAGGDGDYGARAMFGHQPCRMRQRIDCSLRSEVWLLNCRASLVMTRGRCAWRVGAVSSSLRAKRGNPDVLRVSGGDQLVVLEYVFQCCGIKDVFCPLFDLFEVCCLQPGLGVGAGRAETSGE